MLYDDKRWSLPQVKTKRSQQILLDAADLIEKRGWVQGTYSRYGYYCILGAINTVSGGPKPSKGKGWAQFRAKWRLRWYLKRPVSKWNDYVAQSKHQVVDMLRDVAGR